MYKRIGAIGAVVVVALGLLGSRASAAVLGNLNIANAVGGGVTITSTSVDFLLPVGGGNGAMGSGQGTSVSYTTGTLSAGSNGTIKDIAGGGPIVDFMTFVTDPNLHFDLTSVGPGVANTAAVNVLDPNTAPSSPSAGSPFILQSTFTGTTLTFVVAGIARDLSSPDSAWTGVFTTQLAGVTPFQVQQALLDAGSFTSTYSASINASGAVPEPGSIALLLAGMLPLVRTRRRD
jgi:hypothetical protein